MAPSWCTQLGAIAPGRHTNIMLYMYFFLKYLGRSWILTAYYTSPYVLAYLLILWSRVILEKLTGFQLVKKFPAVYATRRIITAFASARHLSLSLARLIQSIPHHISWRFILILSYHLRLGLPSFLFSHRFPHQTLYKPLLSPIQATSPVYLILL